VKANANSRNLAALKFSATLPPPQPGARVYCRQRGRSAPAEKSSSSEGQLLMKCAEKTGSCRCRRLAGRLVHFPP
jgi:hypothetical protein